MIGKKYQSIKLEIQYFSLGFGDLTSSMSIYLKNPNYDHLIVP